jgi:MFS family permease
MTVSRPPLLAPFSVRSFRFQWPADLSTSWAFEMEVLILGWYVMVESGSVMMLVFYGALQYSGSVLSPVLGVASDRIGCRRMMLITRGMYAALALAMTLLAATGSLSPLIVLVLASIGGVLRPSDVMLRNALIGQTLPGQMLIGALGLSRTTYDSARIAGALTGVGMLGAFGLVTAYVVITVVYVLGFMLTLGVAGRPGRSDAPRPTPLRDLHEAMLQVWRTPELFGAMTVAFIVNLFAYPFVLGLLPYVAREVYRVDQFSLGVLGASFSSGALIGSMLLGSNRISMGAGRSMLVSACAWFVLTFAFGHVTHLVAGAAILVMVGLAQSLCVTPLAAVMLRSAHKEFFSRVMGMRMLAIMGLPLGLLVSGPVIREVGFAMTATLYSVVGLCVTMVIAIRWRDCLWSKQARANHSA